MSFSINGTTGITFNDASVQNTAASGFGFKNRCINGAMMIDQRNAGASVSYAFTTAYSLDRWRVRTDSDGVVSVQQVSDAPSGFVNSLKTTVTTVDSSLGASQSYFLSHLIEGFNIADLAWGTADAQPVTISFRVKSSLTGTFGCSLENSAENRSYPFTYVINSANTWETKTVTIAGDTSGTWLTTNGVGIRLNFGWGVGSTLSGTANAWASADYRSATGATNFMATNGATWQITGVQLEKGSTATSFDYRPYGTEFMLCQRYFQSSFRQGTAPANGVNNGLEGTCTAYNTGSLYFQTFTLPVTMRAVPSVTLYKSDAGATNSQWATYDGGWTSLTSTNVATSSEYAVLIQGSRGSAFTAKSAYLFSGHMTLSAEL